MMLLTLFWTFFQVGLFTVGGGSASLPILQAQVVEKHMWLSAAEFSNLVTIAEMTPGPIALNAATFVGMRTAGVLGAVTATLGCISPSLVIVSVIAALYRRFRSLSAMEEILSALRPVVVALIAAAGLKVLIGAIFREGALSLSAMDIPAAVCFAASVLLLRRAKWNPILTMFACGAAYTLFPLMLVTDALFLALSVVESRRDAQKPGSGCAWRAVFMLMWMLASGVIAYLTFRARAQDAIIYTPFCIKGALMCITYLVSAVAFLCRRPGVARVAFALSSLLIVLGVGAYSVASMYMLVSAYAGKYLILGLIGVWAVECLPLYLRMIGLAMSAHKIEKI